MPSKAGYSWPSGFPLPCNQNNVSRGFDRSLAQGVFRLSLCGVCGSHGAWKPEGAMSWPTEAQGPFHTQRIAKPPLVVSRMLRCFWRQSAYVSLPGSVLGWTELYAHLQCHFASCDWPRHADESHSDRDKSHASTSVVVVGVSPANPIFECGSF
jgi:hypothetical protein